MFLESVFNKRYVNMLQLSDTPIRKTKINARFLYQSVQNCLYINLHVKIGGKCLISGFLMRKYVNGLTYPYHLFVKFKKLFGKNIFHQIQSNCLGCKGGTNDRQTYSKNDCLTH